MSLGPFYPKLAQANLYQILMILTHRDRPWDASGRKQAADRSGAMRDISKAC
jgi:hypothetical protein